MDRGRPSSPTPLGQVFLEPVERLLRGDRDALGADLDVRPRADRHGDIEPAVMEPAVLVDRLLEKDVLPAPEEEHGDLDAVQGHPVPHRRPERILEVRPGDPLGVPGRTAFEEALGRPDERQLVECGADPPGVGGQCHAERAHNRSGVLLMDDLVGPAEEIELERPGSPCVLAEIVRPDRDDGGDKLGWWVGEERPLGVSEIGAAQGGEGTGEPGLGDHPGDDVVAVVGLGAHRIEVPARAERASAADEQAVVPAGCEDSCHGEGEGQGPPVGPANQQGAHRARGRPIQVCGELQPVSRRNSDVASHREIGGGGGEAQLPGEAVFDRSTDGRATFPRR